jgi:hypothetical protein
MTSDDKISAVREKIREYGEKKLAIILKHPSPLHTKKLEMDSDCYRLAEKILLEIKEVLT